MFFLNVKWLLYNNLHPCLIGALVSILQKKRNNRIFLEQISLQGIGSYKIWRRFKIPTPTVCKPETLAMQWHKSVLVWKPEKQGCQWCQFQFRFKGLRTRGFGGQMKTNVSSDQTGWIKGANASSPVFWSSQVSNELGDVYPPTLGRAIYCF